MSVDVGRTAVYAAEIAAFEGTSFEALTSLAELVELADSICGAEWWPHARVAVAAARSDAASSSTRQRGSDAPVIRLAAPQMTPATLVHELAHVLAGVRAGHGPVFRRAYVDLARTAFGDEPANWLSDQWEAFGLTTGARSWASPSAVTPGRPSAGGRSGAPIALP